MVTNASQLSLVTSLRYAVAQLLSLTSPRVARQLDSSVWYLHALLSSLDRSRSLLDAVHENFSAPTGIVFESTSVLDVLLVSQTFVFRRFFADGAAIDHLNIAGQSQIHYSSRR
jgi:hypothetical protein